MSKFHSEDQSQFEDRTAKKMAKLIVDETEKIPYDKLQLLKDNSYLIGVIAIIIASVGIPMIAYLNFLESKIISLDDKLFQLLYNIDELDDKLTDKIHQTEISNINDFGELKSDIKIIKSLLEKNK